MLLDFFCVDIDMDKVKNVSVFMLFMFYMFSIIKNFNFYVKVGGVSFSLLLDVYCKVVIGVFSNMSVFVDQLLGVFMFVWGIKIGEVDVVVIGVLCFMLFLVLQFGLDQF